ncbi:MAG: hypothetical protein PGN30_10250 [Mycolicibacterium neoaurum]|uniref:hypothetical protein n=1 Tax=Mycolicibacterium neoaurum TaxID=1795 RepID=UPI002FF8C8D6
MITTVIVAHHSRAEQATNLATLVGADEILFDDGTLGPAGNHRRAWDWHTTNTHTGWALVLEDDAQPVPGFDAQLYAALTHAPTDVVSLYLGQQRPRHWQGRIEQAIVAADMGHAAWIIGTHLLHAVAVAARAEHAPVMAHWTRHLAEPVDGRPVDGNHIAYTWPSLVDHADLGTVTDHPDLTPRTPGRVAWRTGTRTNWNTPPVQLS